MAMTGTWTTIQTGNIAPGQQLQADEMILLTDGSVLIHNSDNAPGTLAPQTAAQWLRLTPNKHGQYDKPDVTWSPPLPMTTAREYFASGVMRDGRVFVIGGEDSSDTVNTVSGNDSPLGEIFDPVTSQWTPIVKPATFSYIQGDVPACLLADGRVLLGDIHSNKTVLWDPASNSWTAAATGPGHGKAATPAEETWTLLRDGSVLTVDVFSVPNPNVAERYIPESDAWVPAGNAPGLVLSQFNGVVVNEIGPAILLPNGTVFAIGATGNTALYNPAAVNPWSAGPSFPPGLTVIDGPACLLPNGKVVCMAGPPAPLPAPPQAPAGYWSNNLQFYEFDPTTNATTIPLLDRQPGAAVTNATTFTYQCWFLLLPTGQLMCSTRQGTLYFYQPDPGPQPGWEPVITNVPGTITVGGTFTITGTQLTGLSQAVSYGDDGQMATNYPLVQLTGTGSPPAVRYLRTFNFSSLGVAVAGPVTADVEVPCDLPVGQWTLRVVTNGIASDPVVVNVVPRSNNPFNFTTGLAAWLHNSGDGADDVGENVNLGGYNRLRIGSGDDSLSAGDISNTTTIANGAEQNPAITGQNQSTGDGVVGVFGESDGCRGSIGVAGTARGWGVAGAAVTEPIDVLNNNGAAGFTPYPSGVGVFGAGENVGVYGQNRASAGQRATALPSPGNVGVYGVGDTAGARGDNDTIDPAGAAVGTGVVGISIQGVGVVGQGTGGADSTAAIPPYIGVHGLSQAHPAPLYPPRPGFAGTGVLGVGDVRGGVFEATPQPAATTFANVQLPPLQLPPLVEKIPVQGYAPAPQIPHLPDNGVPGDIVAVDAIDGDGHPTVELWICIRPAAGQSGRKLGATWARLHFDNVVTMPAIG
jgi:hypothetical protein